MKLNSTPSVPAFGGTSPPNTTTKIVYADSGCVMSDLGENCITEISTKTGLCINHSPVLIRFHPVVTINRRVGLPLARGEMVGEGIAPT